MLLIRVLTAPLRLGSRSAMLGVGLLATALASTSVGAERALDDWIIGLAAEGRGGEVGLSTEVGDCFRFAEGSRASTLGLMDAGNMLPWWSEPGLKVAFFRPLAAATHWLDQRLWPNSAVAMHLQSLLWFVGLLAAAALVYRRLASHPAAAGLAFALFALDDAHGMTVAWLSNRNALIAGAAGCLSLYLHDRGRRRPGLRGLAWLSFLVGWTAGEVAIGALAYLLAYAVVLDQRSIGSRLCSVAPYLAITVGWRALWSLVGYGVSGSDGYVDPLSAPVSFLASSPSRWLSLLQGQLGVVPSDVVFLGDRSERTRWLAAGVLTAVGCASLLWRFLSDARARFWALGMVLSLFPLAAAFPSDRLLSFVGLGAMGLLAHLFDAFCRDMVSARRVGFPHALRRAAVFGLFLVHAVLSPALLPLRAAQLRVLARAESRALDGWLGSREVVDKTVVILSAPSLLLANYAQARHALLRLPRPRHLHVWAATDSAVRVERLSSAEVSLTPADGFLATDLERHYRTARSRLGAGAVLALSSFTARVASSTTDGRPRSVQFTLRKPLSEYLFLCWSHLVFERCELPPEGQSVVLPREDFGAVLAQSAVREWRPAAPPSIARNP